MPPTTNPPHLDDLELARNEHATADANARAAERTARCLRAIATQKRLKYELCMLEHNGQQTLPLLGSYEATPKESNSR